jgi:hypothetical protein
VALGTPARLFGAFEIEAVETTYGISGKQQKAGEVLISG